MSVAGMDRCFSVNLGRRKVGECITLESGESRHLALVRRHRVGDEVLVIDGQGGVATSRIVELHKKHGVVVEILDLTIHEDQTRDVHIACDVQKGDRMQTLLDMATQLGVAEFSPVEFERSQPEARKDRGERWKKVVVEALKQSRRLHQPVVNPLRKLDDWLLSLQDTDGERLVADAEGSRLSAMDINANIPVVILIGPEGGFTDHELHSARTSGFTALKLSEHILRVETAVVAASGLFL